jgi:hypothetical protein
MPDRRHIFSGLLKNDVAKLIKRRFEFLNIRFSRAFLWAKNFCCAMFAKQCVFDIAQNNDLRIKNSFVEP